MNKNEEDNEYLNREFELRIWKEKGWRGTRQIYKCEDTVEIAVGVATMIEQLLRNKILTPDELLKAVQLPLQRLKEEEQNGNKNKI